MGLEVQDAVSDLFLVHGPAWDLEQCFTASLFIQMFESLFYSLFELLFLLWNNSFKSFFFIIFTKYFVMWNKIQKAL